MSESAKQILFWKRTDGKKRALLLVKDKELSARDVQYKRFELCTYDSDSEQWETDREVEYIDEVLDFGIPEDIID